MFYVKNIPVAERFLRCIVGVTALVFGMMSWGTSILAVVAGFFGVMLAITGLIGFCPMCAAVGRKLKKVH